MQPLCEHGWIDVIRLYACSIEGKSDTMEVKQIEHKPVVFNIKVTRFHGRGMTTAIKWVENV